VGEDVTSYYPDRTTEGPHHQFEKQELRTVLSQAIERLGRKEKLVVSLYYFEELTMKEIGLVLKVNESRVSQIHAAAMANLRDKLKDYGNRRLQGQADPPSRPRSTSRQRSTYGTVI
jgi:RNA polymerase sigma factor for flagellar operon FliA